MKTYTMTEKSDPIMSSRTYVLKREDTAGRFKVIDSPCGNCQVFSIAYFNQLINLRTDLEDLTKELEGISLKYGLGKRLCLVDIRSGLYELIKDHVNIYSKMEYVNLTGSQMVTLLIKAR